MKTLQHGLMLTPWKEGWQTGQPDEVIVGREKGAPRLFFQLVPGKNAVCFRSIIADRRFCPSPLKENSPRWKRRLAHSGQQQPIKHSDHLVDLGLADSQCGHEAQQFRARPVEQQSLLLRRLDNGCAALIGKDQGA